MTPIIAFVLLFVFVSSAIWILIFFSGRFVGNVRRNAWQVQLDVENMHVRRLADELGVVYQELSWKNKRLTELSASLQKTNQQIQSHSEFQAKLFAMVSHDLRNAVGSVYSSLGYFFQQYGPKIPTAEKYYLDVAHRSSEHVKYLAESLTEYLSLKRDDIKIARTPVNFLSILEQIVPRFSFEAERKKITFTTKIPGAAMIAMGDFGKLSQVFGNLLHNAMKFTPNGGKVHLEAAVGNEELRVSVVDNGCGIKTEDKEKIFGEFYCSKNSLNEKQTGWGLGLAIVRHVLQLHQGSVRVESEGLGKGAAFICTLPLASPQAVAAAAAASQEGKAK